MNDSVYTYKWDDKNRNVKFNKLIWDDLHFKAIKGPSVNKIKSSKLFNWNNYKRSLIKKP